MVEGRFSSTVVPANDPNLLSCRNFCNRSKTVLTRPLVPCKSHPCQNPGSRKYPPCALLGTSAGFHRWTFAMAGRTMLGKNHGFPNHPPLAFSCYERPVPGTFWFIPEPSRFWEPARGSNVGRCPGLPRRLCGLRPQSILPLGENWKNCFSLGQDDSMISLVCKFIMVPCVLIYKYNRHNIHIDVNICIY